MESLLSSAIPIDILPSLSKTTLDFYNHRSLLFFEMPNLEEKPLNFASLPFHLLFSILTFQQWPILIGKFQQLIIFHLGNHMPRG